jgi:hypothetical protein
MRKKLNIYNLSAMQKHVFLWGLCSLWLLCASCKKHPDQVLVNQLDGTWTVDKLEYVDPPVNATPLPQTGVFSFSKCTNRASGIAGTVCDGYYALGSEPRVNFKFDASRQAAPSLGGITLTYRGDPYYYFVSTLNMTQFTQTELTVEARLAFSPPPNADPIPSAQVRMHLRR